MDFSDKFVMIVSESSQLTVTEVFLRCTSWRCRCWRTSRRGPRCTCLPPAESRPSCSWLAAAPASSPSRWTQMPRTGPVATHASKYIVWLNVYDVRGHHISYHQKCITLNKSLQWCHLVGGNCIDACWRYSGRGNPAT